MFAGDFIFLRKRQLIFDVAVGHFSLAATHLHNKLFSASIASLAPIADLSPLPLEIRRLDLLAFVALDACGVSPRHISSANKKSKLSDLASKAFRGEFPGTTSPVCAAQGCLNRATTSLLSGLLFALHAVEKKKKKKKIAVRPVLFCGRVASANQCSGQVRG